MYSFKVKKNVFEEMTDYDSISSPIPPFFLYTFKIQPWYLVKQYINLKLQKICS